MNRSDFINLLFASAAENEYSVVIRKDIGNIILFVSHFKGKRLKIYVSDYLLEPMTDSFDEYMSRTGKWRNLEDSDIPLTVSNLEILNLN